MGSAQHSLTFELGRVRLLLSVRYPAVVTVIVVNVMVLLDV